MERSLTRKKIIGIAWTSTMSNDSYGGVEEVTSWLLKNLVKLGYEVSYFRIKRGYLFRGNIKIAPGDITNFADIIVNQNGYDSLIALRYGHHISLYTVFHNDTAMHSHLFSLKRLFVGLSTKHDDYDIAWHVIRLIFFPFWRLKAIKYSSQIHAQNIIASKSYVVLSPKYIKTDWKKIKQNKIYSIYNPMPTAVSKVDCQDRDKKTWLVVSRLREEEKGLLIVFKAFKKVLKEGGEVPRLIVVGDGPSRSFYERFCEKSNLVSVEFVGQKASKQFFEASSFFIMTSHFEGWGLTIFEALASGCTPVITNNHKLASFFKESFPEIILVPRKVGAISKCIREFGNGDISLDMISIQKRFLSHNDGVLNSWKKLLDET